MASGCRIHPIKPSNSMFPATEYLDNQNQITIQIAKICVYSPGLAQKHKAFCYIGGSQSSVFVAYFQVPGIGNTKGFRE